MHRLRAVQITPDLFFEVLDLFNARAGLTKSEKIIAYQVLAGLRPHEAAELDDVAVETKRSHLKKACEKLQCAGQPELVRLTTGQLIHVLYLCDSESPDIRSAELFSSNYLGPEARLSVQRLSSGRLVRFWEIGPHDGRPVHMVHGYLFPFLLLNAKAHLEKYNMRLIVPLRNSFLDDQKHMTTYHKGDLLEKTLDDLADFIRLKFDSPIPVFAHATGFYYCMLLQLRCPGMFSSVFTISLNLLRSSKVNPDTFSSRFLEELRQLAEDRGILELLAKQFQRTVFSNDLTTRTVLRRLFRSCKADIDALDGKLGAGRAFDWYQHLHRSFIVGISGDFGLASLKVGNLVDSSDIPLTFLQGTDDPFTSVPELTAHVENQPLASIDTVDGGGQFMCATHNKEVWEYVGTFFQGSDAGQEKAGGPRS